MAKKDSWSRFGSPYDPGYRGTGKIPFRDMDKEYQRERYEIRGCGDPMCAQCNSHIPDEVARSMPRSLPPNSIYEVAVTSDMVRLMEEEMRRRMGERRIWPISEMDGIKPYEPAGPPQSFKDAREKVEKWISKAPDQQFDDIIGNDEALGQLRDAIEAPKKHKKIYEAYGMRMPKGALLSGPPRCGKTMFARAAASEMKKLYKSKKGDVEFISISGSELQSPYVGVTESYIKAIFDFAREYKAYYGHPLLVFMDEAEVLLPDRTGRVRRVSPWEESQVATFLAEMDGMQESGAFMLLATNRPEVIDQAVLRDGRCDFKITVKRPTQEAVQVILERNFKGILAKDPVEDLVFAALESLWDPHKILVEFHAIKATLKEQGFEISDHHQKHFLLEHIVSGAMAAGIPHRAIRYAFARDKLDGEALGVTVADVVTAVNDVYEENKGLEHEFAMQDFRNDFFKELEARREK